MWITKFELSRYVTIFGDMENISGIKKNKKEKNILWLKPKLAH